MTNNFRKSTLRQNPLKPSKKMTRFRKLLPKKNIKQVITYIVIFFLALAFLSSIVIYIAFIKDLPSVEELENLDIAESSTIYDRDGNVLYNIYKEKRTYIEYEKIAPNMVNAIVSGEDKRFWDNPGFDVIGLVRAFVYGILGKGDFGGTSTITQQLIRNTIIENRSSTESIKDKIGRKVKEIYLSYRLTNGVSKEKIVELYLNKISFGNNAYGIEQASKTYFDKSAIDLNILESSILASIPKGQTYYSPYTRPDRVLGYIIVFPSSDEADKIEVISSKDVESNKESVNLLKDYIANLKGEGIGTSDKMLICGLKNEDFKISLGIDNDGCSIVKYQDLYLQFLNGIRLRNAGGFIEYQTGRKDFILGRMLEDGYINFEEYKEALLNSIGYTFNRSPENIKAPHFVFFIKEYLAKKFGEDILSVGGLQIYTTLDSKLQAKAEELITKQVASNSSRFDAKNSALISLDNKNGDILAYVGGVNYFDEENKGNVDIVTSPLQPGSSFKPFVYSVGIYNREIGSKTPIYDLQTTFPGSYTPKNFEGGFEGKLNISTALNHSRNIPAIKMFYMAGGEANIVSFMKKLGVTSLKDHGQYGAPLALGTGEMTPLELATAYSVFANLGEKVEINPILKIVDRKGNVIEEKKEPKKEPVISAAQTYIINSILSDTTTRPSSRNSFISLGGTRPVAAKTGTSTKQFDKNGVKQVYPANLWVAGYTPQITTVVWSGNTDGSQVGMSGDGLNASGPIWRDFMYFAHEGKAVENWKRPSGVYEINISEISGLLPNPENSASPLVSSLFINKPTKYDQSYQTVLIDTLCNGIVSPNTPPAAVKEATLIEFHSLNPENPSWENPVQEWARSDDARERYGSVYNLVTSVSDEVCQRSGIASNVTLGSNLRENGNYFVGENYLEIGWRSSNPIKSLEILINDNLAQTIDTEGRQEGAYIGALFLASPLRNTIAKIEIRAVDNEYYSTSEIKRINIGSTDNVPPVISMINPTLDTIKIYEGDFFNLRFTVEDTGKVETTVTVDGGESRTFTTRRIDLAINENKSLEVGNHKVTIRAKDASGNVGEKTLDVEVMRR